MPFELIENCNPGNGLDAVPPNGVRVQSRHLGNRRGGATRFIRVSIGDKLAHKLVWRDKVVRIDLAFGSGRDAGKIRASINLTAGQFAAKRDARGRYNFTINAATADGLFALQFPPFAVPNCPPVEEMGKPPVLVFAASDEMLAVDD